MESTEFLPYTLFYNRDEGIAPFFLTARGKWDILLLNNVQNIVRERAGALWMRKRKRS